MDKNKIYLNKKPYKSNGFTALYFKQKKAGKWIYGLDFDAGEDIFSKADGSAETVGSVAGEYFMRNIKKSLEKANIKFDIFFKESSLHYGTVAKEK